MKKLILLSMLPMMLLGCSGDSNKPSSSDDPFKGIAAISEDETRTLLNDWISHFDTSTKYRVHVSHKDWEADYILTPYYEPLYDSTYVEGSLIKHSEEVTEDDVRYVSLSGGLAWTLSNLHLKDKKLHYDGEIMYVYMENRNYGYNAAIAYSFDKTGIYSYYDLWNIESSHSPRTSTKIIYQ